MLLISKEQLRAEYEILKSLDAVAEKYETTYRKIRALCTKYDIEVKHSKYSLDLDFFKRDTPESLYLAGFLAADGWLTNSDSAQYTIGIALKDSDVLHLNKIKTLLDCDRPIYKRIVKNSKRNPKYRDSITYSLVIRCKEMFDDLQRFNLTPQKSLIYVFPFWIKNHKYVSHFLRGYFDGDGSISIDKLHKHQKTQQARIHLRGTIDFLTVFHEILYREGAAVTENKKISTDSNIGSLQYTGNKNVGAILDFLYRDATVYLDRKYERYQLIKNHA